MREDEICINNMSYNSIIIKYKKDCVKIKKDINKKNLIDLIYYEKFYFTI